MPRFRILLAIAMAVMLTALSVASVAAADPPVRVYRLVLTGDQEVCEVPATCGDPDAIGQMILIVNSVTDTVCFGTRWSDIDGMVTAAHIHLAPAGVAGDVVVPLFVGVSLPGTSQLRGCVDGLGWTDDINAEPAAFYVNIHSTVFPAGAIRAQLG